MEQDVVWTLARNIVKVTYDDLPGEVVEATKKSILDTLGVIEAASGITPGLKALADLILEGGGKKESTILGFGGKVPAWMAAFVNGSMAHCLDYDDIDQTAMAHPSANTVPSGFAVAERVGKVTGRDFITALALGNDLFARLCYSVNSEALWHRTPLFGVFAAAATSGKLLGLNEEQMVDALGLAFCQAAGTMELRFGVGTDIGGMRDAFPNKGGVLSALMAQRGIRGVRTCLEGKAGFYNVYYGGQYKRDALTKDLGKKFCVSEIGYKYWPACGATQAYIESALALVGDNDIRPENIAGITASVGDLGQTLCQPLEGRRRPQATMDAKYSVPFTVAVAVAKRKVIIDHFSPEALKDPAVLEIAAKVTPKPDASLNLKGTMAGDVEIKMKSGQVWRKRIDFPYGHPERPMNWEDIANKFRDCLTHAAKPVAKENVEKVIDMVGKLEKVKDAGRIMRLLG